MTAPAYKPENAAEHCALDLLALADLAKLQGVPHIASALRPVARAVVGDLPNEGSRSPRTRLERLKLRAESAVEHANELTVTLEVGTKLRAASRLAQRALVCVECLEHVSGPKGGAGT